MDYERLFMACLLVSPAASAAEITAPINVAEKHGVGAAVGIMRIVETAFGLAFYPTLKELSQVLHCFHIHEKPSCTFSKKEGVKVSALAAGGHFYPKVSKNHVEPWGEGRLEDLPHLYVAMEGISVSSAHAPRFKVFDVRNRVTMIHGGRNNHSDYLMPLGDGGARVACGVIDRQPSSQMLSP